MNQKDFTHILQNPQRVTVEQTDAVKSIIDEFPYFQSARAIYLKGLKDQNSYRYNQELKKTAAYTTDRSILFDFITSEDFIQNEISESIKKNITNLKDIDVDVEDISVSKKVTIDDVLKQQIKDTDGVLDPALFQPKETANNLISNFVLDESEAIEDIDVADQNKTQDISTESPIDILNIGRPLQFTHKETHSFNEWLKLTSFRPISRESNKIKQDRETPIISDKEKKFKLIDDFIAQNPKINPIKISSTKGNLAKAQMIKPESLMTETLARIYVEQKNYKKAIKSYKILSLKYPEKSGFFANQIKAIEQLLEQNNK